MLILCVSQSTHASDERFLPVASCFAVSCLEMLCRVDSLSF